MMNGFIEVDSLVGEVICRPDRMRSDDVKKKIKDALVIWLDKLNKCAILFSIIKERPWYNKIKDF